MSTRRPTNPSRPHPVSPLRSRLLALACLTTLALGVSPGVAEDNALLQDAPAAPSPVLSDQPVLFEALGLTVRLPEDTLVETASMGGARQSVVVSDIGMDWRIIIADESGRNIRSSPREVTTQIIENIVAESPRRSIDPETGLPLGGNVEVLERSDGLEINRLRASRVYIARRALDNSVLVEGYTVFQSERERFIVFKLETSPEHYAKGRAAYEAVVDTATFPDASEVSAERAAAIRAGERLLRGLEYEDYLEALPERAEWRRLFRPAASGNPDEDREIAYQRIEIREGFRGELSRRPRDAWAVSDHDEGLIARIAARYLDAGRIIDSESIYYMTPPGTPTPEESWTVRMAIRDQDSEAVWMETGVRRGGRLTVRVTPPGSEPTEKSWQTPSEAYLTQVETYLLPRLLAHSGAPLIFGFYAYNSSTSEISLRRDVLSPAPDDEPGWTLRTRMGEGAAERVSRLSPDGEILRVDLSDGTAMEPIEVERLRDLWRSKGLPTN
ncbi:MAG: hypothetical protein EA379_07860 [Phycisphaerales bacterium]|nr:MAG: hypothetical protein EA379_07860 [Phycisphaerales bacterium]